MSSTRVAVASLLLLAGSATARADQPVATFAKTVRMTERAVRQWVPGLPDRISPMHVLKAAATRGAVQSLSGPSWSLHVSDPTQRSPLPGLECSINAGAAGFHKLAWGSTDRGIVLKRSNMTPYGVNGRVLTRTAYPVDVNGTFVEKVEFSSRRTIEGASGSTQRLTGAVRYYLHQGGRRTAISEAAFRDKLGGARQLSTMWDPNLVHDHLQVTLTSP